MITFKPCKAIRPTRDKAYLMASRSYVSYSEEHLINLKEILLKEVTPVEYTPKFVTNKKAKFVYGSDKHIGALTKLDSIYKNKYDREVMKDRIVTKTIENIDSGKKTLKITLLLNQTKTRI